MIAETNDTNETNFSYVWQCENARPAADQSIPIRNGDYLFICVMKDRSATFRYRSCDWRTSDPCKTAIKNEAEWAGAKGEFDGKNTINGRLATSERQFKMTITPKGRGFTISCEHFVNPSEGEWQGDDGWGGTQPG